MMTRKGWRRVERAWQTSPGAPVLRVTTSDGRTITGTENHLVHANGGWMRLDALAYGDILTECPEGPRSSSSTGFA
ncbi:Hint domain-containing protein, partial [Escherichia coli]|uniref:Hint domain-containing protein n=1 Tax=Escherichia coli TaxID=562 RepID=UPI001AEBC9F3